MHRITQGACESDPADWECVIRTTQIRNANLVSKQEEIGQDEAIYLTQKCKQIGV